MDINVLIWGVHLIGPIAWSSNCKVLTERNQSDRNSLFKPEH